MKVSWIHLHRLYHATSYCTFNSQPYRMEVLSCTNITESHELNMHNVSANTVSQITIYIYIYIYMQLHAYIFSHVASITSTKCTDWALSFSPSESGTFLLCHLPDQQGIPGASQWLNKRGQVKSKEGKSLDQCQYCRGCLLTNCWRGLRKWKTFARTKIQTTNHIGEWWGMQNAPHMSPRILPPLLRLVSCTLHT